MNTPGHPAHGSVHPMATALYAVISNGHGATTTGDLVTALADPATTGNYVAINQMHISTA